MKRSITIIRNALNGILNVCWKASVVVLACCAAYFVYDEFDGDINDFIHPWEYGHSLSPSIFVKYNAREECFRLYKWKTGGSVSRAKYKIVNAPDVGDLAVFKDMDNHFGYLNVNTGKEEIPAMYRDVFEFSEEGIAAVVRFEDDSLRFITTTGELAIDKAFVYDNTLAPKFYNGFCVICERTVQGRRYGLIDLNGSWVLKPEFTDMEICAGGELVYVVVEGENGETLEGRWNCKGYWEYQPVYQDIEFNNLDNSVFLTLNNVKTQVAADGTVIEPFVIDDIDALAYEDANDWYYDNDGVRHNKEVTSTRVASYMVNGKYGLLDIRTGNPLTPAKFGCIMMLNENLFRCEINGSRGELLYNANGQQIKN